MRIVDLREIFFCLEALAQVSVGTGCDVEEVVQIEADDAPAEFADEFVPQVVERGVEQADRRGGDHLRDVVGPAQSGLIELAQHSRDVLDHRHALSDRHEEFLCRKSELLEHHPHAHLEPLKVGLTTRDGWNAGR